MALPIRDGNQSLTTLSTIIVNSAHVPAHSVVSLGSQAITDIAQAVSGVELGPNTISALENISVTFGVGTSITIGNVVSVTGGLTNTELRASSVTVGVGNFPATQTVTFTQASVTFGQAPVTFGTAVITGSTSILNFPATQTITFTQASVTFGTAVITGSTSILNFPATQTTTFSAITGSVSILNLPATQTVTFTQASVTFGTAVITGSVSVLNLPATQTVTFTQASTTFGSITGSVSVLNLPATQTVTFTQASVTFGTPVVTGSVSVLNFPSTQTIAGTVTANVGDISFFNYAQGISDGGGSKPNYGIQIGYTDNAGDEFRVVSDTAPLPISGTVTANVDENSLLTALNLYATDGQDFPVSIKNTSLDIPITGTVTANLANVVTTDTFWNVPAIKITGGNGYGIDIAGKAYSGNRAIFDEGGGIPVYPRDNTDLNAPFPVAGTVTANNPVLSSVCVGAGGMILAGGLRSGLNTAIQLDTATGYLQTKVESMPAISGTVTANLSSTNLNSVTIGVRGSVTASIGNSVTIASLPAISGTVTANVFGVNANNSAVNLQIPVISFDEEISSSSVPNVIPVQISNAGGTIGSNNSLPISGTVTANNTLLDDALEVLRPRGYAIGTGLAAAEVVGPSYDGAVVVNGLPAVPISGTVTANNLSQDIYDAANDWRLTRSALHLSIGSGEWQEVGGSNGSENPLPIAGTVTANALGTRTFVDGNAVTVNGFLSVGGWDSVNSQHAPIPLTDSGTGVRVGFDDTTGSPFQVVNHPSIPLFSTISGAVTANVFGKDANNQSVNAQIPVIAYDEAITSADVTYVVPVQISNNDGTIGSSNPLPIAGTVTVGAMPSGALTTRFGSTTTANSTQLSSAVTNSNRKYLLIQNVTTSANIITVGIGFSPTTTQGIQLSAGAGITFEGSYIPTGAVYFLSSVTASPITIIEA